MTHKARVLALLRDGKPHGHMEGYRLGVMLHSRVADLRRDGHVIECWRDGDNYLYQLLTQATPQGSPPQSRGREPYPEAASVLSQAPNTWPTGSAQPPAPSRPASTAREAGDVLSSEAGGQLVLSVPRQEQEVGGDRAGRRVSKAAA
jgi:hypothetical protein